MPVYICSNNELAADLCRSALSPTPIVLVVNQAGGFWQNELPTAHARLWTASLRAEKLLEAEDAVMLLAIRPSSVAERDAAVQFLAKLAEQELSLVFAPEARTLAGHPGDSTSYPSALPATRLVDTPGELYTATRQNDRTSQVRRLLAMDGLVCARYLPATRQLAIEGTGSVLLATLHHQPDGALMTFTIDVLTAGMQQSW